MRNTLSLRTQSLLLAAAVASIAMPQLAHADLIFAPAPLGTNTGGYTQLVGTNVDNTALVTRAIGFNFSYYGTTYTNISTQVNGNVGFANNNLEGPVNLATTTAKILAVFQQDNRTRADGYVQEDKTVANVYTVSFVNDPTYNLAFSSGSPTTTYQASIFGANVTVNHAGGSFNFQAGDIAFSYNNVQASNFYNGAGALATTGIANGAGTFTTPVTGPAGGGQYTSAQLAANQAGANDWTPNQVGKFLLFRPTDINQTSYTVTVAQFAVVANADVTVTPGSGSRTATGPNNTVDITATAGTYDITGTTLTGNGFSVANIADATGTTGNKNGVVSFASAGKLNGDYSGTFGFTIANANLGNGAHAYTLSTTVTGNTGNQSAVVAGGTDLGSLSNKLSGTSDKSLGSVAALLDGTLSGDSTISMSWRNRDADEIYPGSGGPFLTTPAGLYSDVLDLSGIAPGDIFVLQMSYSEAAFNAAGLNESGASLGYLDGVWKNAIAGNTAGPLNLSKEFGAFVDLGTPGLADDLGRWGVDTSTNTVWAVINHNSEFAVIPEPTSMGLLALGGLALLGRRRRA